MDKADPASSPAFVPAAVVDSASLWRLCTTKEDETMMSIAKEENEPSDDAGSAASEEEHAQLMDKPPTQPPPRTTGSRVKKFLLTYFLPIGFAASLLISIVCPEPGKVLSDIRVQGIGVMQTLCVCIIFFISGLCFNTSDIKGAIRAAQGLVFGVVSSLLLTPMSGFVIMDLGFVPRVFRVGLSIFVSVPTTLTLGVALLEQAGGNEALGLLLTILSNLFGIVTVPFVIHWTIGSESEGSVDPVQLLLKLSFTLLTPLILGKLVRETSSRVRQFVSSHRSFLSCAKNGACVGIVWLALSHSREELIDQKPSEIAVLVLLCSVVHTAFLIFNFVCCFCLRVRGRENMAVVILASQKTLPVCLAVISYLDPKKVGDLGLLTIPCLVAHLCQLFIDSSLLSKWRYEHE